MSISKAQAEALADEFLDELGTDKGGIQPKDTLSEAVVLAAELAETAQLYLEQDKSNASGKLSDSIQVLEPITEGGLFITSVEMNFYGRFINSGVKGRKSGAGVYAFKYNRPSRKMVDAIQQYIRSAGNKIRNTSKRKTISGNEKKNISISEAGSAYAMAQAIVNKGIRATGFMDKAVQETADKVSERLGAAFSIDIINSLDGFENLNK